jgi:release factor glutamine methyltransferase
MLASVKLVARHAAVYEPSEDSFALVDALAADAASLLKLRSPLCVEIGCGSGYVITSAALLLQAAQPTCFATDVNPHAAAATQSTLEQHGLQHCCAVVLTDLAAALEARLRGCVDLLLFNPPYVPSLAHEVGGARLSAAWAGGERGRAVIDRLLPRAAQLLSPRGTFYMVAVRENDVPELLQVLRGLGLDARIALTRRADEELLHIIASKRCLLSS